MCLDWLLLVERLKPDRWAGTPFTTPNTRCFSPYDLPTSTVPVNCTEAAIGMAVSIVGKYKICRSQFQSLLAFLKQDSQDTLHSGLGDEFDKFCIWADSVGAVHPPTSSRSLDHRLRFASPYKEEVSSVTSPAAFLAITDVHSGDENPRYLGEPAR